MNVMMQLTGSKRSRKGIRAEIVALSLCLFFSSSANFAVAAAPVISTKWTIANGADSPPVFLDGSGFAADNDKFDFTVDVGTTGLEYDSVAFVDDTHMRFNFHGKANTGTITIQANASAFFPVASEASNTISISVPVPLVAQNITFTAPSVMKVKDPDQVPIATSSSGLTVLITSNTPSTCTIDFLKIHAVAEGTCSLTANANGNSIYSQAIPVTRSFSILPVTALPPNEPQVPVDEVTNLGSVSYDPKNASGAYVAVLVAGNNLDPKKATLVKLLVPPNSTKTPVVFLISSFSSDVENSAGYFVALIKSSDAEGAPISAMHAAVEINIPAGAADSIPSWSLDGKVWYKLKKIESEVLPADYHAGYFIEKDGRIAIFTDYLMLFGHRKLQEPILISSPSLLIKPNVSTQISNSGGSGTGEVGFYTRTLDTCTITPSGLLTGLKEGKCIVAATKAASGVYSNAISSAITVFVQRVATVDQGSGNDLDHEVLCQELSYTLLKTSSLVYVNLCAEDAGKTAYLEIGTKSKTGTWSYVSVLKQKLDSNGTTFFKMNTALKIGQIVRVLAEGKVQISTTITKN